MAGALIIINQSGKPPGIAGAAREDLDLLSGTNPIVLTNSDDEDVVSWAWTLLDRPNGCRQIAAAGVRWSAGLVALALACSTLLGCAFEDHGSCDEIAQSACIPSPPAAGCPEATQPTLAECPGDDPQYCCTATFTAGCSDAGGVCVPGACEAGSYRFDDMGCPSETPNCCVAAP